MLVWFTISSKHHKMQRYTSLNTSQAVSRFRFIYIFSSSCRSNQLLQITIACNFFSPFSSFTNIQLNSNSCDILCYLSHMCIVHCIYLTFFLSFSNEIRLLLFIHLQSNSTFILCIFEILSPGNTCARNCIYSGRECVLFDLSTG